MVATSTAHAEMGAIHDCIQITKSHGFLQFILDAEEGEEAFPLTFNDNMSALQIAGQDQSTKKSRHMMIRLAHVKEHAECLAFVNSDLNLADALTKHNMPAKKYIQLFTPGLYERDGTSEHGIEDEHEHTTYSTNYIARCL